MIHPSSATQDLNDRKFGNYCCAAHMLKNWEISGFGLTQQNRTHGGNYGEGENLRSYIFFLVITGTLLFPKAPHHDPVVCLSVQQHRASIWVGGRSLAAFQESLEPVWCLSKVIFRSSSNREEKPLCLTAGLVKTPQKFLQTH